MSQDSPIFRITLRIFSRPLPFYEFVLPLQNDMIFHFGRGHLYGVRTDFFKKNHLGALLKTCVNMPQDSPIFRITLRIFSRPLLGEEKICKTAKVICMVFIICGIIRCLYFLSKSSATQNYRLSQKEQMFRTNIDGGKMTIYFFSPGKGENKHLVCSSILFRTFNFLGALLNIYEYPQDSPYYVPSCCFSFRIMQDS